MYIAGFVGLHVLRDPAPARGPRRADARGAALGRLGGVGVGAGGLRRDLHAAVHGLPHQPGGAVGRPLREPRLLARPARRRPRRREALLLRRRCCSARSGRCCCWARVGAVLAFRQPTVLRAFLVWGFALSLAIYSWAGEKFAWLVLHPLLPLILLAGPRRAGAVGGARHAARAAPGSRSPPSPRSTSRSRRGRSNVEHRADPRELLVSTQSSEEVKRVADEVLRDGEEAAEAVGDGRLLRRRDVPLRLVLPRPRRSAISTSAPRRRRRPRTCS